MSPPRKTAYVPDDKRHTAAVKVRLDPELAKRLRAYGQDGPLALLSITEGMTMEQMGKIPGGRVTWHDESYAWHDEDDMEIA